MKDIYKLKLHEQISIDTNLFVTRVPGGWLYSDRAGENLFNTVFVPFHNEFQKE